MKVVSITLQVPKAVDDFYRDEARTRITSKSNIIRDVLIRHVARTKEDREKAKHDESLAA